MSATAPTQTQASPSPSKPRLPIHVQISASPDALPRVNSTLVDAFKADPVLKYIRNHLPSTARLAALENLIYLTSNAATLTGGELWSASTTASSADSLPDFQLAAIIFPPGKSPNNIRAISLLSLLLGGGLASAMWSVGPSQFVKKTNALTVAIAPVKKTAFPNGEEFFYLEIIGASSQHRGMGLASALIRKLQERADREGKPIYLEASARDARRVYQKLGFKDIAEEVRLGKGECDAEGEVDGQDGVGVSVWPMLWEPKGDAKGG